jgi:uncharacterized membrane protein
MSAPEHETTEAGVPRPRRTVTAMTYGVILALGVWALLTAAFWAISPPILYGAGIGTHSPPPMWLWAVVGVLELVILTIAFLVGRWRYRRLMSVRGW